mmetsp:Transcript_10668/g.20179  ORF Transcript_10668/g.20179 Transcript_10668/m.20179 type:complete len:205 (-) Transcript_10668:826-1440(-)|eukprot:CAMPEP_0114272160 /NCGR_PEP_ID=MMETSP0058-20121206/28286_1 /TAXON_ID=36894 /ORGANISM="Pyramimonas parkeae, CCMP726" /LENGTH=204 /DNA_ID=CAMNT_0001391271 /DNA_START=215 /DNA_END=829 /DNA_ORIENTATION=-
MQIPDGNGNRRQWRNDVDAQTTNSLSTTGGHVWDAARRLHQFLGCQADEIGLTKDGASILELGAGCGWLGLNLAINLPHAKRILLTEQVQGGAMEHLTLNIEQAKRSHCIPESVEALACDWMHYTPQFERAQQNVLESAFSSSDAASEQEQAPWSGEVCADCFRILKVTYVVLPFVFRPGSSLYEQGHVMGKQLMRMQLKGFQN